MNKLVAITLCLLAAARSEKDADNFYNGYQFRFHTGDVGNHSKIKESRPSGYVTGLYSYSNPNSVPRTVPYNSAPEIGYQAFGEGLPQLQFVHSNLQDLGNLQERFSNFHLGTKIKNLTNLESVELTTTGDSGVMVSSNDSLEFQQRNSTNSDRISSIVIEDIKDNNITFTEDSDILENEIPNLTDTPIKVLQSNTSLLLNSTMNNYKSLKQNSERHLSTAFIMNHGQLFPYWHPYNSYRFIGNMASNFYLTPNPFTYGFIPYHYQLIA
ncbi:hypothetical protein NPIL_497261 [Nephila pilipes]|uniref:Uncharacterized protein n=1 Tax=Nephila pilipes TaxID=299642 RepID=A0A8X6PMS3_NEPPI|nr:hypothetical protein NPIL_497261 [Nephila pilipes]